MEECARLAAGTDAASLETLIRRLGDADWQVRFAAAVALGDRRDAAAIPALLRTLREEDAAPVYGQEKDLEGIPAGAPSSSVDAPGGVARETIRAWERRGRLKQAACLALGSIRVGHADVLTVLRRYATSAAEDYAVRAASAKALGQIADTGSVATLEQTARDEEWCTSAEARKALQILRCQPPR
jgi:HEAT repeat protein